MIEDILGPGSRVDHKQFGEGIISSTKLDKYRIAFFQKGIVEVSKNSDDLTLLEAIAPEERMLSVDDIETTLEKILRRWSDISEVVPISDKWRKGTMILKPYDPTAKAKEFPIETFFHKIVMLRDRLRVMEQKVNAHKGLAEEEKMDLQQYITRIYGSLTTFNILFKYQNQVFVGAKGDKEE